MSKGFFLYIYSAEEAQRRNELALWRESFRENIRCKEAIETAIRENFDGMYLNEGCAAEVIDKFGFKRVRFVLANTLQELEHDGRFSRDNKDWGKRTFISPDKEHNYQFCVSSHPAVLDGFINEYRKEHQALGLFNAEQCVDEAGAQDYTGKVLVMKADVLNERYWKPEYQLWYAHDGFGCEPNRIGRSIRSTCLFDREECRWNRTDFVGPIDEKYLPDWAKEQVSRIEAGLKVNTIQDDPAVQTMS